MVIDAINEARAQVRTYLHTPSQLSYADSSRAREELSALLADFDRLERVISFKNQELPPKRERGGMLPSLREFVPPPDFPNHPSVWAAIMNVLEGCQHVRDGPD